MFPFPKLSLSLICFGPSAAFVDKVKSGALVPTASGISESSVCDFDAKIQYRFGIQRVMLGPVKSIGWHTIIVLVLLTLATYALDVLAGYFGAKYFGATKWGTFGAILGALIGLFFGLIGLFVGPVIGATVGEVIAGKRMIDAGRAGWGSLLGTIGAMLAKLIIALAMIAIFLVNVPSPF